MTFCLRLQGDRSNYLTGNEVRSQVKITSCLAKYGNAKLHLPLKFASSVSQEEEELALRKRLTFRLTALIAPRDLLVSERWGIC